jgi:hypothetical protein
MLGKLFARLEQVRPGIAAMLVSAAESRRRIPDELGEIKNVVEAVRNSQRRNRGLARRVLEAVLTGGEITEAVLFPSGRPKSEATYSHPVQP